MANNQFDVEKIINQSMTGELKGLVFEAFNSFREKTLNSNIGDADSIIEAKSKEVDKILSYIEENGKLLEQDAKARVRERERILKAFDYTPERKEIEGAIEKVVSNAQKIVYQDSGASQSKPVDRTLISREFLTNIFKRNKIRVGTKYDKNKDSNFYFDTETTGKENGKDLPVTIGTFVDGIKSNYFIDSKNSINNLLKAVEVIDDETKELYDSAIQLRKRLGLDEKKKISRAEMTKAWESYKKANQGKVKTLKEIVEILENAQSGGRKVVGYNVGFDMDMLSNLAKQSGEIDLVERLAKIKTIDAKERVTSKTSVLGESKFLGTNKLQDMVKMFLGEAAKDAHDAASDAENTALIYNKISQTNFLQVYAQALQELAKQRGIKQYKDGTKVYSDDFKKLARNLFDSMVDFKHTKKMGSSTTSMTEAEIIGNEVQSNAQRQVVKLFQGLGDGSGKQTVAQKALSGQHLIDRAEKLGKNFSNITASGIGSDITDTTTSFAKGTSAYYLEQIINAANAKGWNVALQTNGQKVTLGLYPEGKYQSEQDIKWDEIAKIDIGLVDDNATIQMGGTSNANIMYPTVTFEEDGMEDGKPKWKVNNVLETANELQLKRVLDGISGSGKISGMLEQKEDADMGRLQSSLRFMRDQAFSSAPTTASSAVIKEATGELRGSKTPEQMAGITGMVSVQELAKILYGNKEFRDEVNQFYQETIKEDWKKKEVDVGNLSSAEIEAVNVAIAMIAEGWIDESSPQVANLEDGLIKRILTSDTASLFRKNIQGFVDSGLAPTFESLKEESFIAGQYSISGSHDILPFNTFGDFSSRALNQIFNRNRRANTSTMGRGNLFTSSVGRKLGVNYSGEEMKQYVGASTNDKELFNALVEVITETMEKQGKTTDEINKEINQILTSVKEGGMIISQSMAKDLMSYRERNSSDAMLEDIDSIFLSEYGLDKEMLKGMNAGDILKLNTVAKKRGDFSTDFSVDANDLIIGIKKTENGYRLITEKLEQVSEGTKLLTDVGGRQTARILDDSVFEAVTGKLGVKGANFLTEKKSLSSKTAMESIRGRVSYIITQALEGYSGADRDNRLNEIEAALKAMPVLGDAIKRVGDKFELNAYYDRETKGYKYLNENGEEKELFSSRDDVRTALIEGQGSAIEFLGKTLLGSQYDDTKQLIATAVNMAKEVPYFEVTGGGTAEIVESSGRVKYARREREAFTRVMDRFSTADGMDQEGLGLYTKVEQDLQNRYGPIGEQAKKDVANLENAVKNKNGAGIKGKKIELVWGNATKENQIDISDAIDKFEYDESEGRGISQEDYAKSVGGKISEFLKNNSGYENAEIVLDLASSGVELANNANKVLRVANVQASALQDGTYMPSVTDKGITSVISAVRQAKNGEESNVDEAVKDMYSAFYTAATSKDSSLYRKATESYMANSSYVKIVGQNDANVSRMGQAIDQAENTVAVSPEHFKKLLSTQVSSKTSSMDYAKNLQNLSRMIEAVTNGEVKKIGNRKLSSFENVEKMAGHGVQYLSKLEEKMVNLLLEQVKNGKSLVTQFHRYPSTSGMDIRHGYLTVNDSLEDGVMAISRGASQEVNGDYDGDKMWLRPVLAQAESLTREEYMKAYGAASQVADVEAKIAKEMAEWERAKDAEVKDETKQQDAFIDDIYGKNGEGRGNNRLAAIMSKHNKQYVGQFSNAATFFRRSMSQLGMDSIRGEAGKKTPVYSALLSAFTEVLEQDSISAKKVAQRLSNGKNADVAINELGELYKYLSEGDFIKAIEKAGQLGIMGDISDGIINTRQFKLAQATLKYTDPKAFEASGLEKGVTVDLLKEAVRQVEARAKDYNLSFVDMLSRDESKVLSAVEAKGGTTSSKERAEEAQVTPKIDVKYKPSFRIEEDPEYDKNHIRTVYDENDKAYTKAVSFTELMHRGEPELPQWEKEKGKKASASGTYAHKLMELMTKNNVTSLDELKNTSEEDYNEAQKALAVLKQELQNDATPTLISNMQERAINLAKFAKENNMISENAMTEVTLGGKFEGMEEAISGQADLINFDENGFFVGDWKFSGQGGVGDEKTIAERIMQASFYLRTYEAKLETRFDELGKAVEQGTASDADRAEFEDVKKKLELIQKNATIKIARNFEKDGQQYNEILEAQALDKDFVFSQVVNKANGGYMDMAGVFDKTDFSISTYNAQTGEKVANLTQTKDLQKQEALVDSYLRKLREIAKIQNRVNELTKKSVLLEGNKKAENDAQLAIAQEQLNVAQRNLEVVDQTNSTINGTSINSDSMERLRRGENDINREFVLNENLSDARIQTLQDNFIGKKQLQVIREWQDAVKKSFMYERDIAKTRKEMEGLSGDQLKDAQAKLNILQRQHAKYNEIVNGYNRGQKILNGVALTDEQVLKQEQFLTEEHNKQDAKLIDIAGQYTKQKGLLAQIAGGFKNAFRNITDASLAYMIINQVKQVVNQIIESTKELDAVLVDIQIATGNTRGEVHNLLKEYSNLADELGTTTQSVATASNDWLRAGYEGQEAAELTRASVMLSKLGMIEAGDATTYLISTLKGWKIEASEVLGVVDKLTVTICGVCLEISIGHEFKCR